MREPVVLMLREQSKWLNHKGESTDARHWGGAARSVRLAAYVSGGLKSHSACGFKLISKSRSNVLLAKRRDFLGRQGVHREVESEGFEENRRAVINGSHSKDEPVGQR